FQAEDGIRDFHVTGVQTCALPILITTPQTPRKLWCPSCGSRHRKTQTASRTCSLTRVARVVTGWKNPWGFRVCSLWAIRIPHWEIGRASGRVSVCLSSDKEVLG